MVQPADGFLKQPRVPVAVSHRDPLLRLGLLASLRDKPHFDAIALDTMADMDRWCAIADGRSVAVCDYETGAGLAQSTARQGQASHVLVVTHRDREADIQGALALGVQGYILVGCRLEEVAEAVLTLSRGQRFLSTSVAQRVASRVCYEALTPRENEVLRFVVVGWSNKMVAAHLGVTEGTVKSHVKAILSKLAVRTRTEAANVAMRRGLVLPDGRSTSTVSSSKPLRYDAALSS